jgi:hypothetical protein
VWDNNDQQDYHLPVTHTSGEQQLHVMSRGLPSRGLATVAASAAVLQYTTHSNGSIIPSAATAAAATTPVQSFSSRADASDGVAGTVLRLLESLRICAIGDGCGFISPEALDRAEQSLLHGANAPALEAAAAAEAKGLGMFLMPQSPVPGLPVALYVNKARLQDALRRAPSMCLQVGFNNWSLGVQKVCRASRADGGGLVLVLVQEGQTGTLVNMVARWWWLGRWQQQQHLLQYSTMGLLHCTTATSLP